jgi:hypothetical protein
VQLKYVPPAIGRGSNARVAIAYNLVTAQRADMDVSIMTWNWYAHTPHAFPYHAPRKVQVETSEL